MNGKGIGAVGAIALTWALVTSAAAQIYSNSNRTMVVGGTLLLGHYANVYPNCSSRGPVAIRVTNGPSSGAVRVRQGLGFAHFSSAYQQCNNRKVVGAAVSYTPQSGFVGSDSLQLDVIYATGVERIETFAITVK